MATMTVLGALRGTIHKRHPEKNGGEGRETKGERGERDNEGANGEVMCVHAAKPT